MGSCIQTRTMARLYLDQDLPDRALEILLHLQAQQPEADDIAGLIAEAKAMADGSASEKTRGGDKESESYTAGQEAIIEARTNASVLNDDISGDESANVSLRERAADYGSAVVEQIATQAIEKLENLLARVLERRRR